MVDQTIIQNWLFKDFILPFIFIFVLVFAVLDRTKILGEDKKQLNAILAFVVSLIFLGFAFQKGFVTNMILFLSIALVVILVFLLIYGFATGSSGDFGITKGLKWTVGIVGVIVVIIAILWSSGIDLGAFNSLFNQNWSQTFWTNVFFVVVIAIVLAVVIKWGR
ncbi:MAG: hypothetical protein AABX30_03675 [Nanoarchaeota archaeon]